MERDVNRVYISTVQRLYAMLKDEELEEAYEAVSMYELYERVGAVREPPFRPALHGSNMTKYDPHKHHRRSIRLKDYNYASAGCYFVTICVRGGECLLGKIVDGEMVLNEFGRIALESWLWLAERYDYISLDESTFMPNHMHGIIVYHDDDSRRGASRSAPTTRPAPTTGSAPTHDVTDDVPAAVARKPLGRLIGAFKTVSTQRINNLRGTPGETFWQRNYWEHIIRNECALLAIREYILYNPARWEDDKLHPGAGLNPFNEPWKRPR